MRFSINLNWILSALLSFTVITLIAFILFGYICFKFLKFHYISSNNSISDYDTMAKDILETYGNDPIQSITIVKKKLTIPTIFLIMIAELPSFSPSNFSNLLKMYHTGLIFHVKSQGKFDQHIYIEKSNKVSISQNYSVSQNDKIMTIFIDRDEKLSLNIILEQINIIILI